MSEWHSAEDGEGHRYFYNDEGETRWDRPEGYVTSDDEDDDDDAEEAEEEQQQEQPADATDAGAAEAGTTDAAEAEAEAKAKEEEEAKAKAEAEAQAAAEAEAKAKEEEEARVKAEEEARAQAEADAKAKAEAEAAEQAHAEASAAAAEEEDTSNAASGNSDNESLQRQVDSLRAEKEQLEKDKNQLQSELAKERVKAMTGGSDGGGSSDTSKQMIDQAEKLMKTTQNFAKAKEKASKLESEIDSVRGAMVRQIAGASADSSSYQNVPLSKLLDLYKKSFTEGSRPVSRAGGSRPASRAGGSRPSSRAGSSRPASRAGGGSDSRNNDEEKKKLQARIDDLESEVNSLTKRNSQLQRSNNIGDGTLDYGSMPSKLQNQKRMYGKSQKKLKDANEKIVKLSQHIEKLMLHLKHESAAKVKSAKTVRRLEKTTAAQKEYIKSLESKLGNRDRTIKQLRAGAKILEDQLQLMDEKYIEIRGKLDWTRQQSKRQVAKIQKEANDLRAKWALAGGLDLEHLIGKGKSKKMSKLKTLAADKPAGGPPNKRSPVNLPPATKHNNGKSRKRSSSDHNNAGGNQEVASHLPWSDQKTSSLASESR